MDTKMKANTVDNGMEALRLSEAQDLLFAPGVQLRIFAAITLCIFITLLPLMIPFLSFFIVPVVIFIAFPMLFGLAYMGEKAKNREVLSVKDVFHAFYAHKYWYSIRSVLLWAFLWLVPLILISLCIVGTWNLCALFQVNPAFKHYFVSMFCLCVLVTVCLLFCFLLLLFPAYLFLTIRTREPGYSVFRVIKLMVRLMKGNVFRFGLLQLKYSALILLSIASVCTLFPIYTIPLIVVSSSLHLDQLIELH